MSLVKNVITVYFSIEKTQYKPFILTLTPRFLHQNASIFNSKAFHFVIIKSYIRKKQNIENDNNFFVIITFF